MSVAIELQGRLIRATIADTGRGIPPLTLKEINAASGRLVGVGIPGMKERVRQIGGHLDIQSDRRGTVVTAVFPPESSQVGSEGTTGPIPSAGSTHLNT